LQAIQINRILSDVLASIAAGVVAIWFKMTASRPKLRSVDLLRQDFAELRKSQAVEEARMVAPTIPRQVREKKEASPKHSSREVQTGVD
jgi:hypothetical protein